MKTRLEHGDMRKVLRKLIKERAKVHAIVTDPPYNLASVVKRFGKKGSAPAKGNAAFKRASAGFMGMRWDSDVAFQADTWRLAYELLPPGGHLIAFGGTRTYHRLVTAIEEAGFEIRDTITWHYGSGFPKSHNVAKGIAKRRTEDLEPVRAVCRAVRAAMDAKGLKSKDLAGRFKCDPRLIDHWAARDTDSQPNLPTMKQWAELKKALEMGAELDGEVARLNKRKGTRGKRWTEAAITGAVDSDAAGFGERRFTGDRTIRELDGEAAAWEGWGTALKPATELICLARKPLEGSVAANVLKHGTGALNIDGCRVATGEDLNGGTYSGDRRTREGVSLRDDDPGAVPLSRLRNGAGEYSQPAGRWPANVCHDGSDEVVSAFPAGGATGGTDKAGGCRYFMGGDKRESAVVRPNDTGSAARFFYSSKADADDRLGSKHPTVKPVDLMRWLVRLVTPPGGTVLDPFAGSGSTLMACMAEGFDCIMVEKKPGYLADIRRRVKHVKGEDTPLFGGPLEQAALPFAKAAE